MRSQIYAPNYALAKILLLRGTNSQMNKIIGEKPFINAQNLNLLKED